MLSRASEALFLGDRGGVNGKQEGLELCWEGKVRRAEFSR